MAGFVKSEANESLFRRYRFLTQKSTGRFEPHRLIALANALVALDQPSVLSDIRRSVQTKESHGKDGQAPYLETVRVPDCDRIVVSANS
ncbi:hypothetical protein [Asticcacaulis benevestitus]|uniref:Uncharacterized protein n=1 Tax=Asticcacaulis benevestitus DSM 16100 = ATCC BAA-896 TaxID=1121022 RepID=V4PTH3_9CAUL|nr:hypothetical protein [Asticcacaulis benevestitus]ESQ88855.1 hypothetical protein ABENE_15205 [Asticcacaulis benevestitus DSM 16100 = ATCC BAA-896]